MKSVHFRSHVTLPGNLGQRGTGWQQPPPDRRDYSVDHPKVAPLVQKLGLGKKLKAAAALPPQVDLRPDCSPIEDQQNLGSCTAFAAVGMVEYFERRAFQKHIDGSHLYVYKNTRNLLGWTGDTGAWVRVTMGALALCGIPDEWYWPYTDQSPDFDRDPSSFVYSLAENYQSAVYFAHDPYGAGFPYPDVLASIKAWLAYGFPAMFGFFGFPSSFSGDVPGSFPFPGPTEQARWGHAVLAVGYDDNLVITNLDDPSLVTTGALLIRNSWGAGWGNQGYGWLPYEYVLQGFAEDFWTLLDMEWVETGNFGL